MDLLMNGLLTVATLFAGGYCWVLARRVRELKSLDKGLGGAIVTLTRQIELARATLDEARASSKASKAELGQLVSRADAAAGQLRLLLAAAPVAAPRAEAVDAAPAVRADRLGPAVEPAPGAVARPAESDVPKPRALRPVENPLRRFRREPAEPSPASEDAIIDALQALAGAGR